MQIKWDLEHFGTATAPIRPDFFMEEPDQNAKVNFKLEMQNILTSLYTTCFRSQYSMLQQLNPNATVKLNLSDGEQCSVKMLTKPKLELSTDSLELQCHPEHSSNV